MVEDVNSGELLATASYPTYDLNDYYDKYDELISNLLESRTAVKSVEQPLPSFGGRLPESAGLEFYYRVSERLRPVTTSVTVCST